MWITIKWKHGLVGVCKTSSQKVPLGFPSCSWEYIIYFHLSTFLNYQFNLFPLFEFYNLIVHFVQNFKNIMAICE
jgi:hypothetical protein